MRKQEAQHQIHQTLIFSLVSQAPSLKSISVHGPWIEFYFEIYLPLNICKRVFLEVAMFCDSECPSKKQKKSRLKAKVFLKQILLLIERSESRIFGIIHTEALAFLKDVS